ncbi:MAG: MG2 domain-containing protein [Pirellulaceae bacterium]|nr:MG2 domain-containing protein [Pirellulaceae bacterium]
MKRVSTLWALALLLFLGANIAFAVTYFGKTKQATDDRSRANRLFTDGNFKEAYDLFSKLATDENNTSPELPKDLARAVDCLNRLGRQSEFDTLVEESITVHGENWKLLQEASRQYGRITHNGFLIGGEFKRGGNRGGGKVANSRERDRIRALQLLAQATPLANKDSSDFNVSNFYFEIASQLLNSRGYHEAWRLQYLTDLTILPDYEEGYGYYVSPNAAPVDEEGNPVYYDIPPGWNEAKSDGQRWRWALAQAQKRRRESHSRAQWEIAQYAYQMYGVHTIQQSIRLPQSSDNDESGTYALHTLEDNETIARLATGIKRITLREDYNFLRIYKELSADKTSGYGETSANMVCTIYQNRRQYPEAAAAWETNIETYGPGTNNYKKESLSQITDHWGRFENTLVQHPGQPVSLHFRYRNAKSVKFTAKEIKLDLLLADVKKYLKSNPQNFNYQKSNTHLSGMGYQMVNGNQKRYVGKEVASWTHELTPRDRHFDRRDTINTPLQKGGAYLIEANVQGGNTSSIIVMVADMALVRKQLSGKNLYYLAEATSGTPVAGANIEFFGYKRTYLQNRKYQIDHTNFAERTDKNGFVMPDPRDLKTDFQWLVTARDQKGRMAYLGFSSVWTGRYYDNEYNATKAFTMTDRPVYRPNQKVQFKTWIRHAKYDKERESNFANKTLPLEIWDPLGNKIFEYNYKTDEYGGLEGEFPLPIDAKLGVYSIRIRGERGSHSYFSGGNTFRVEEYKKPEFEVTVTAPEKPVMLGEKIEAKIEAKYYFGSPVTEGTVKYTVTRTSHTQNWYPVRPWDWCYGPGYWWFGYDYNWYPGARKWIGCFRPHPWWYGTPYNPPEVVLEREVSLGSEGTVTLEIDTELAKEIHGDTDHKYSITAEVRDLSRRTIVGNGEVLVARQPFKVFTWVDRGYYQVGQTIEGNFKAQTLDNRPVVGTGKLSLLKITYKDNKPTETPVQTWDLNTNTEGEARQQIKATQKGQYRLSYTLKDDDSGHEIEGGYLFTVIGDGFDGSDYRFNHLELIPDQSEYHPNDTVNLQINTDLVGSTVLLFVRPANGTYLPPQVIKMRGKSTVAKIKVTKKDMPNFFVEAVTIANGGIHTETKEIVVPPEKRILNLTVEPSATEYKPGEEATVKIKMTDHTGENFVGSTVVTIYDKSVEYISGGSNVPEIKEFFWKWRRRHNSSHETNLEFSFYNLVKTGQKAMRDIGVFGYSSVNELALDESDGEKSVAFAMEGRQAGGFGGGDVRLGGLTRANRARGGRALTLSTRNSELPRAAKPSTEGAHIERSKSDERDLFQKDAQGNQGQSGNPMVEPTVRSNFADTALWVGSLTTDRNGQANVTLTMPENLTTWKMRVWGMGHGTRVGSTETEVVTRKNLILRLQAPRFFVQKDEVVLSANVHNYLETEKTVSVQLELPTGELQSIDNLVQQISIPPGGEKRVDWRVKVLREGQATIRMKALSDEESDAMEMKFPCYVHGMLKTESWAGTVRPDRSSSKLTVVVPSARRVDQSLLEIRYSPSLAAAMVDALPYLADYPYGCTEQTLNRFLPTVITQKVLQKMNLDLEAIGKKRTNLNAQEIGDDKERAKQWKRFERNPVFDQSELDHMVKDGLEALTNMQLSDGGWGWFSGPYERSDAHTTSVVVHGLQIAQENDVPIVPGVLENGIAWLKNYQDREVQKLRNSDGKKKPWKSRADNLDAFVYMILADAGKDNTAMQDFLYRDRIHLAVQAKGMFGLGLHKVGKTDRRDMVIQNIEQFLIEDEENETAYLKLPVDHYYWHWYGSEIEANAYYLKLLTKVSPKSPTAPRMVKYLLNNRKHATYWRSTRDTATCVEAFADYIHASGETTPDMTVEIWVDGTKRKESKITAENLFTFDNKFVLSGLALESGSHEIEIRRQGKGAVYFNTYLTNFTLEDHITKAGLEIKVDRKVYKLVKVDKEVKVQGSRGQAIDQKVEKYNRVELTDGDTIKSGDLIEVDLLLESKNDYEYLLFEDKKAAGFEAIDQRSGYTNNGLRAYMEVRDERVSFFVRQLARGKNSVSYRLRAEIPGKFSALPAIGYAMYAPELKANSDEIKLKIID